MVKRAFQIGVEISHPVYWVLSDAHAKAALLC